MELKNLSSNWKQLQKKLQSDKPKDAAKPKDVKQAAGLKKKCKLADDNDRQLNGTKRKKSDATTKPHAAATAPSKKRKMGSLLSTASTSASDKPTGPPSASLALFAEDHDIPVADVAAAYNLPTSSTSIPGATTYNDVPNAGLAADVSAGKYIALDCEMVGVGPTPEQDSQLARASLVDFHGRQLYDSYVLPQLPVTDYRTAVSGITAALLRDARPFATVQREVSDLLEGRILVGHAIKNDLDALMLTHPKRDIRDTSRHPAFRKLSAGKAPSLRKLAKEFLGVEIQSGEHSSVEDARATMLLFRKEKEAFEAEHARKWGRPQPAGGAGKGASKKKKGKK
ncbi:uncharacterized protein K452DRAFT_285956 [Aplosporella prunicola CBS 121167]|uniref:RNA exonuclease 4 n=1 Tax=Aplosporella prunicola CBS 121167 TaxID=1176127 RepID=A0A6A6BIS6_9PEZI|nr:uncharacterized protein K452DRAFT_285956 [Aplosporella prunicola CBS 121167]KAF2143916.1 hypothetical protein K452DRAFT_285956 [Aplosporella prunicola CBS 121167]